MSLILETSQQILIVGPSWVGDMIMAQSLFKKLKQLDPDNQITVLAPKWTHPILIRMSEVDSTQVMPVGHGRLGLSDRFKLAKELKNQGFDQAIILPGSLKSALIPFLAGIPKRTAYLGEQRYGLVNDIHKLDKSRLPTTVQRFVNLSGASLSLKDCPVPELVCDEIQAKEVAAKFGYVDSAQSPLLLLCPGAEYGPAKRWPIQRFAQLAKNRLDQGWQVWLMGSEKDKEICDSIKQLADQRCQNLAGRTNLTEAIDLMSLANAVVTNDSGLMHLAASLKRPLVAIYGSSSPDMTPPLSTQSLSLWLKLDCAPCFKRHCPLGHLKCLYNIEVAQVNQAIDSLIDQSA